MKIYDVTMPEFAPYGRIVEGYPLEGILEALRQQPVPEGVDYKPQVMDIFNAKDAQTVGEALYGGMPFQLGYCNGHNRKLNCLEYHRDSEFNLAPMDFILLLGKQDEIDKDGRFDTSKIKAFRVPAGVLVEVYATTLHYAPCSSEPGAPFQVMVALPLNTNTDLEKKPASANVWDRCLWARNKWLIAHAEASEAADGAFVGLTGVNIDLDK